VDAVNQIDCWAQELKSLRTGAQIKRFRQRFDKETAQRIIRSPELSELDRAAITLTIQFASSTRWDPGDSCFFTETELPDTLTSLQQCSHGGKSRHREHPPVAGDLAAAATAQPNPG
jgi:hypothetical protein